MSMKQSQKCKKRKNVWRVIGGIVFTAGMCVIIPKFIEKGSDYLYKKSSHPVKKQDDDDWEPEIVKRSTLEGTKDGEI